MIYHLRRKNFNKWSGIQAYSGSTIAFTPAISKTKRKLNTGLTKEQEKRLEGEEGLFLSKGSLSSSLSNNGYPASSYWLSYGLEIPEKGLDLDTDRPEDELAYTILNVSDITTGRGVPSSTALFELYNIEEEAKTSNNTRKEKTEAYKYYAEMSPSDKFDYCISKGKDVQDTKSEIIDDLVGRDLETSASSFNIWVKNDLYKSKVRLYKYIQAKIIRKAGVAFYYNDIQLGISEETAIEFLNRVTNQKVKEGVLQEYKIYLDNQKSISLETEQEKGELIIEA